MAEVYLGLGSNVAAERHIGAALAALEATFGPIRASPVYRNPAVGFEGNDFYNLVVGFETKLAIEPLKVLLHEMELRAGRARTEPRFGPRTLDLDLLLYGDETREAPKLPHPDILKRAFVLCPLSDLAGDLRHPVTGRTFSEHWLAFAGPRDQLLQVKLPEPPGSDESKI